jgi:hypothetical protein
MKKILLVIIISTCFTACPLGEESYNFFIENYSEEEIAFIVNVDENNKTLYPDTLIISDELLYFNTHNKNMRYWGFIGGSYKDVFKGQDTLSIFIFSVDTLKKYSWEQIRYDYNILVRYDLTDGNIGALRGYIPYPPNEAMRNMKMYPKYF